MSSVYLIASDCIVAKKPTKQTAYQLGQATELPYFKAFEPQFLTLSELYQQIDQQIQHILQQTGWQPYDLAQIPIFIGSTGYLIADCEARFAQHQPLPSEYNIAVIGHYLRQKYQTEVFSFATSCTSAAQGVAYAYKMIKAGVYAKALVIGFEAFNRLTFEHFHSMHLLATGENYLPFIQPEGIVLGEGLACLAFSNEPPPSFQCELQGMTCLTDNENLTNSSEEALRQLLQEVCQNAQIEPKQIEGIKVHAVGGNSDEMEMKLLQQLFPQGRWILVKPMMGHTLGASGATETAFLWDCFKAGKIPPLQKNTTNLPLANGECLKDGYYLSYFLGFGGSNVAWLIRFTQEQQ